MDSIKFTFQIVFLVLSICIANSNVQAQNPTDACGPAVQLLTSNTSCTPITYLLPASYAVGGDVITSCVTAAGANDRRDGWYRFVATGTTTNIDLTGDRKKTLAVFTGSCGTGMLACDLQNNGVTCSVSVPTVVGTTYYIQVHRNGGNNVNMNGTICIYSTPIGCSSYINTYPHSEGFETGLGNWNQSAADNYDWTRDSGGTPSGTTGPTTGSGGSTWYMFLEASGRPAGTNAYLESDCFDFSALTNPAIDFDNHMYGTSMGSLELFISNDFGTTWTSLWSQSGDQGNQWNAVSLSLVAYAGDTVQFRFVATIGSGFASDAAIDNINIYNTVPMTYISSTVTQTNTSTVANCNLDQEIIGVEVVTNGILNPIDITQFRLLTDGSTDPLNDISNIDIFYTGTSSTFATTNYFGSAAPLATGTNILVNGTQTLSGGTNYFWIVYDLNINGTVGNMVDASCNQVTVDGSNYTPTVTNPGSGRQTIICPPSPGAIGQSNLKAWFKANSGTGATSTGDPISQWNDNSPLGINVVQVNSARYPTFNENNINYNPSLLFDGVDDRLQGSLGGNDFTSDFSLFCEFQFDALNAAGAFYHNHITPLGNSEATSFQIDSDGSSYVYKNQAHCIYGAFNTLPRLFSIINQNAGVDTEVDTYEQGGLSTNCVYPGNERGQHFRDYSFGVNRLQDSYGNFWGGELIVYSSVLSAADKNKVETYLAIKYGHTLDNTGGGTAGDYTSAKYTNVWDADNNSSYHNNVIGIAREDLQELNQKQSHTRFDTTRIYLNTLASSNALNAGGFNDFSFIMIGENQGNMYADATSSAEVPGTCSLYSRLGREWKVTRTSASDNFSLDLTLSANANPGAVDISHLRFLVDDDGDFSNGGTTCYFNGDGFGTVISYSNLVITISGISTTHIANNNTNYITIASIDELTTLGLIVLPVELISFDVDCVDERPSLNWATASEINNDYFTIERSTDAIHFEAVGTVNGNGNSNTLLNYTWTDYNSISGTAYYRLKQTDFDGTTSYSKIVVRSCKELGGQGIYVYPNPFDESFAINLGTETEKPVRVTVLDCTGKLVHQQIFNNKVRQVELSIGSKLVAGVYILKVDIDGIRYVRKLIKE